MHAVKAENCGALNSSGNRKTEAKAVCNNTYFHKIYLTQNSIH